MFLGYLTPGYKLHRPVDLKMLFSVNAASKDPLLESFLVHVLNLMGWLHTMSSFQIQNRTVY